MSQRKVTQTEREQIYVKKQAGQTLSQIAQALGLSYACVRKWWRRGRDEGLIGLVERKRGRPAQGSLSQFSAEVKQASLKLKREHKRWGAVRVIIEMRNDPALATLPLPSRSRLYGYFRQHCPDCLNVWTKHIQVPVPPVATAVHEVWQVDHQEGHHLGDESVATVCSIRDPYGAAMIASQAFSVKTKLRWRKLSWEEVRQVLRLGFIEWQTLPDSILTDNEMGLGGNPNDPFPSWLSLYLAGLGIKHNFIRSHQPTDQPQVERNHRTLDGLTDDEHSRQDLTRFQQALDQERHLYNHQFPSRASDCNGLPPLQAHPALLRPRRPYRPEWEVLLFDLQRVYDFLATFTFERKVNRNGQVTLKGHHYTVGLAHKEKSIQVRLDPNTQEWMFFERNEQGQEQELSRRALFGMDFKTLTGFEKPENLSPLPPVQLTLPLAV
jgi:transposase-like protein